MIFTSFNGLEITQVLKVPRSTGVSVLLGNAFTDSV